MIDQNFLDEVGMIDKNIAKIDHADADDVSVARQFAEHFERALVQRAERPAFEPSVGSGGELVAARPHTNMLAVAFPRVNARECGRVKITSAVSREGGRRRFGIPW